MVDSKGSKKVKVSKLNINSVRGRLFIGCWLLTFSIDVIFILFGLSMNDPDILRNIAVLVVPPVVVMILSYYRPVLSVLALSGFIPVFLVNDPNELFNEFLWHFALASSVPATVSGLFLYKRRFGGSIAFKSNTSVLAIVAFSVVACFGICCAETAFDELLILDEDDTIAGDLLDEIPTYSEYGDFVEDYDGNNDVSDIMSEFVVSHNCVITGVTVH